MSRTNEMNEELKEIAADILLKIKAIKTCLLHNDILLDQYLGEDECYARATALYKKEYGSCLPYSFEAFHDAIKKVLSETYDECPYCGEE